MIYLDSCLVIYLREQNPDFFGSLSAALASNTEPLAISPLVKLECLVGPLKQGNRPLEELYREFFEYFQILPITEDAYELAAKLRAEHGWKTPDAIHVATAQTHKCTAIWTNDDRLAKGANFAVNICPPA